MRELEEDAIAAWSPPTYRVDESGKVVGAEPGSPNNWGRWGDDDQLGTANLLTDERIAAAARLIRTGRRVSLGIPMGRNVPGPGSRGDVGHFFARTTTDQLVGDHGPASVQSSDDLVVLPLQASTQLDGLAHVGHEDVLYNGYWAGLVTAQSGARRLGIHHQAAGIVGRGVLLDVAGVLGIDPFETSIDAAMLDEVAARQSVEVKAGDILLIRTGFLGAWFGDPALRRRRRHSGLAGETVAWLAEHDIAMVAADNRAVEVVPGPPDGLPLPLHVAAIRDLGLLLGELFELDELAEACRAEQRYEFFVCCAPLVVRNAVGSPLNPVAVF